MVVDVDKAGQNYAMYLLDGAGKSGSSSETEAIRPFTMAT